MRLASFVLQPYSRLCQEHFTEESYQRGPKCLKSLGLENERLLLKDYFCQRVTKRKKASEGSKEMQGKITIVPQLLTQS